MMKVMNKFGILLVFLAWLEKVSGQSCPEQPNAAVIVVVSVLVTLLVVFAVAGIIFLLLWRRRRALSNSNKHRSSGQDTHDGGGVANPAFTQGETDISLAEQGVGGYIQCQEYTPPQKNQVHTSNGTKVASKKKSWTPNSKSELPPGRNLNSSLGSLDDLCVDPEVTSIWLQSQDFIGLGFNIAGSMRDGIYISQVHNRGPAVESGKFAVGDRILSVTVSFQNMVYEDALTILSYASPYPVKITLQKDNTSVTKDRRNSNQKSILSHPLYRSQSLDTLLKISKDPVYTPKRSMSEMRQSQEVIDSINKSFKTDMENMARNSNLPGQSPVEIHVTADVEKHASPIEQTPDPSQGTIFVSQDPGHGTIPAMVEPPDYNDTDDVPPPEPSIPPPPLEFDDNQEKNSAPSTAGEFAALFDKLNEQDKLDMLRLSYEDPDSPNHNVTKPDETSGFDGSFISDGHDSALVDSEPKSPSPVKPERRKKKTSSESSSISSMEEGVDSPRSPRDQAFMPEITEDHIFVENVHVEESAPPTSNESEVFEDFITPQKKKRDINITSNKIELSAVDTATQSVQNEILEDSPDMSRTLVDYSLSDIESSVRPQTPENEALIEEDTITPVQLKKGGLESSVSSKYFDESENSTLENTQILQSNQSKSQNDTISSVDFNLNMTSNPDLFSTPYPKRNTKEGTSGMSYDISMRELNDIESKLKSEQKDHSKGGVAFEIRDDIVSGKTVLSGLTDDLSDIKVSRTKSCDDQIAQRSLQESSLEWSGKRLVRSGSFSDIPQDDSVSDWTDNTLGHEDSFISTTEEGKMFNSSDESLNSDNRNGLKKTKMFGARENLANLSSENSDSLQSITDSTHSSRGSTPPPYLNNNGEKDNGLGTSPESSPVKTSINLTDLTTSDIKSNSDSIINISVKHEENGPYSLTGSLDQEEDC